MKNMYFRKESGFTVIEILTAMGIVGVIACMTIPGIIMNVRDAQYKVAWEKAFSSFSDVIKGVKKDNCGQVKGAAANGDEFKDKLLPYLQYTGHAYYGVRPSYTPSGYKKLNGNDLTPDIDLPLYPSIQLTNGMIIYVVNFSPDCSYNDATYITNQCSDIKIDVNGKKGPNVQGRDLFSINVFDDTVLPAGCSGVKNCNDYWTVAMTCNPGSTASDNSGSGCSAKYLQGN